MYSSLHLGFFFHLMNGWNEFMTYVHHGNLCRHMEASLEGQDLEQDHDSGLHVLNKWNCVVHQFLQPDLCHAAFRMFFFSGLKIFISNNCPIQPLLLVGVGRTWVCLYRVLISTPTHSRNWTATAADSFWREACHFWPTNIYKFLVFFEFIYDLYEGWIASFISPEVDGLILLATPYVPYPHQGTRVQLVFLGLW